MTEILAELERIFYPRGVVVVGASNRGENLGRFFLDGFIHLGFEKIYVVHPREKEVRGIKTYPRVLDISGDVDLAVVASPLETVPQVVAECTEKGVKGVVIFTAGFGEKGSEGRRLEEEIVGIARRGHTRIIGPNCMGIYCPSSGVSNFPGLPKESGPVGVISHSGSLANMLTMAALAQGIRFSKVVSCGNECDLNAVDFLEYLGQDPETRIIIAYLEAIKDGRRFYQLAREISKEKPIIVLKGGTTERGARAAASHTGALAGSNRIWMAAFAQTGIISAHSAEEMLDYLQAFYYLPLPQGRRVGIVSGPGGPAVTASDACIESGLELAELSQHTKRRIAELIPPVGTSIDNPIDLGMGAAFSPQSYVESIRALGEDKGVDILLIIGASWHPKFIEMMLEAVREVDKPAAFATMPSLSMETEQSLPTRGLAIYPDGRRAAMSLGKLVEYRRFRSGA